MWRTWCIGIPFPWEKDETIKRATLCTHNNIKLRFSCWLQPNIILLPRRLHKTPQPCRTEPLPQMKTHIAYGRVVTRLTADFVRQKHTHTCLTRAVYFYVYCWEPSHYAQTDRKKNHVHMWCSAIIILST